MDVGCLEHIIECLSGAGSHVWWFIWYFSTISYPYIRKMCVTGRHGSPRWRCLYNLYEV
jgi:hypothetical protein